MIPIALAHNMARAERLQDGLAVTYPRTLWLVLDHDDIISLPPKETVPWRFRGDNLDIPREYIVPTASTSSTSTRRPTRIAPTTQRNRRTSASCRVETCPSLLGKCDLRDRPGRAPLLLDLELEGAPALDQEILPLAILHVVSRSGHCPAIRREGAFEEAADRVGSVRGHVAILALEHAVILLLLVLEARRRGIHRQARDHGTAVLLGRGYGHRLSAQCDAEEGQPQAEQAEQISMPLEQPNVMGECAYYGSGRLTARQAPGPVLTIDGSLRYS